MRVDGVGASTMAAGSDSSVVKAWLRALEMTKPITDCPARILPDMIDDLVQTFGEAPALLSDRECLTFRALSERSNR